MKQLVAAVVTLTAIVAGIVLATSLSSSAQEDGGSGDTTTTTENQGDQSESRFGFRFDGDLSPPIEEFLSCLRDQGIDVPADADRSSMFDLRSEDYDGLAEAIEACGLPGLSGRFGESFPFGGKLPELFPFHGEFPEDFPFHGEFREGFPFGGEGFRFHLGPRGMDRDELASCLAELGSFESADQVREKLDECLPPPLEFGDLDLEGFPHRDRGSHGFPFRGHGFFHFDLDGPDAAGTST